MTHYHLIYEKSGAVEKFALKDSKNQTIIWPGGGFSDFLCSFIEEFLLNQKDYINLEIDEELPDYYARLAELTVGLYNNIPEKEKPLQTL